MSGSAMKTVNIYEAKNNLPKLLENTTHGIPFVIAKAGKPVAKVIPFHQETSVARRIGFMPNLADIPEDFDQIGTDEIIRMFIGNE